jgi:hypothetical protein
MVRSTNPRNQDSRNTKQDPPIDASSAAASQMPQIVLKALDKLTFEMFVF